MQWRLSLSHPTEKQGWDSSHRQQLSSAMPQEGSRQHQDAPSPAHLPGPQHVHALTQAVSLLRSSPQENKLMGQRSSWVLVLVRFWFSSAANRQLQHGHRVMLKLLPDSMGKVKPFFLRLPGREWHHPKFGPQFPEFLNAEHLLQCSEHFLQALSLLSFQGFSVSQGYSVSLQTKHPEKSGLWMKCVPLGQL